MDQHLNAVEQASPGVLRRWVSCASLLIVATLIFPFDLKSAGPTLLGGPFDFAAYATGAACGTMALSGNAYTDSFDSSKGTYLQTKSLSGGNLGITGGASLNGNVTVNGSIFALNTTLGNCQTVQPGITISGKSTATAGYKQLSATPIFTAPPSVTPGLQDYHFTANASLAPGNYGNITVSGNKTLTLSPGVYAINSISLTGNSVLTVSPSGQVILNLAGATGSSPIDFTGGSISNPSGKAANFELIYGGTLPVTISGGADSYAALYAPNAPVKITGGSDWFGAMVVGALTDSGNTALHYDRSLATPPTIAATSTPGANAAGWNNTNVTVGFTCSDPVFSITSCSAPVTVTVEGANQVVTGTAVNQAGFSASTSITLNIDKTLPVISGTAAPPANAAGWNKSNVVVSFLCADALSGIAACSAPVAISAEGAGQVVTGAAVDKAGNTATTSATINLDKTSPTITASITPPPNAAGWNNSNVTVTFTCSDAISGIYSCPGPVQVTTEGSGQAISGTATDKAGNSASTSITVNIDKTAPTITATATPAANAAGWNNSTVTVAFTCSDAGSGIATCPVPVQVTADGANQAISGTATDKAGNTATATVSINLDKTPPSITAAITPLPNAAGWNNGAATVSFTCSDSVSGVLLCPAPVQVTAEGAGQTVSGTAQDKAGNSSTVSASVNVDLTAPGVKGSVTPTPNAAGWNNSNVTVNFVCSDALSGVNTCTPPAPVTAEGANQAVNGSAADKAGNTATASVAVNLDKTPPTITILSPSSGAILNPPSTTITGNVSDSLSGVATVTCQGNPAPLSGGTFTCSVPIVQGANSISVQATDQAGNAAQSTLAVQGGIPTIVSVAPNTGQLGQQNLSVSLTGLLTHWVQGTSTVNLGAGISVASLTINSTTSATAVLNIDPAAAMGLRDVTVTSNAEVVILAKGFTVLPQTATCSLPLGIVSWWPLDSSGQDVLDGNSGTVLGGQFVPAEVASGFNSSSGMISMPSAPNLNVSQFTLESWLRADDISPRNMVIVWKGAVGSGYNLATPYALQVSVLPQITSQGSVFGVTGPGKISVMLTDGIHDQIYLSNSALSVDERFHHVAATVDGQTVRIYIDGQQDASYPQMVTPFSPSSTFFQVGGILNLTTNNFQGVIDELALYNRALTAPEIQAIFVSGTAGKCLPAQAPFITSLTPNTGQQGQQNLVVTITGQSTHFTAASAVTLSGTGIIAGAPIAATATSLTVPVTIAANAPLGAQGVQVVTGSETVSLAAAFTVTAGTPTITLLNPNTGEQGQKSITLSITGQLTHFIQGITQISAGPNMAVGTITVVSATRLTAQISIACSAMLGPVTLVLQTGTELVSATSAFTITAAGPPIVSAGPDESVNYPTSASLNGAVTGCSTATNWSAVNAASSASPNWYQAHPANPLPVERHGATGVYNPASDRMVIFGGFFYGVASQSNLPQYANDVWALSNANGVDAGPQWSELLSLDAVGAPLRRVFHAAVYDPGNNRMTIFGGQNCREPGCGANGAFLNDVWVLQHADGTDGPPVWIQLQPQGTLPQARWLSAAAYNPATNRMIVYGGDYADGSCRLNDLWVLTHANGLGGTPSWVQLFAPTPGPVGCTSAGYDAVNNRLMIFVTSSSGTQHHESWILMNADGTTGQPAWLQLSPPSMPAPVRIYESGTYDSVSNKFVMFGGEDVNTGLTLNDVWVLENANGIGGTPVWVKRALGSPLAGRRWPTIALDSANNRLTVFAGQKIPTQPANNETWILNWAGDRPATVTFVNPTSPVTTASFGSPGTYDLRLTATNGSVVSSGDSQVTVVAANGYPSVNAGGPLTLTVPGTIQLSGQASDDGLPLNSTLATTWSIVSGPSSVTFTNAHLLNTSALLPVPGTYILRLTGTDSQLSSTSDVTITVGSPATISSVAPITGQQGQQALSVTITGQSTHFGTASVVTFSGTGITAGAPTVATATSLTVPVTIAASAPLGAQGIQVVSGAETVSLANAFTVIAGTPVITVVNPNFGQQGQQNLPVNIAGTFTHFAQGATSASFGPGVTVTSLTVNSATSASAILSIDPAGTVGPRDVTVTTTGEVAVLANGFNVQTQSQVCTAAPPGLVNWWPGDGNTSDIIGGKNGTLQGVVTFTAGEVASALTFTGTGSVLFPSAWTIGASDFTIDFWLKTTSVDADGILGKRTTCGYGPFLDIRTLSSADEGGGHEGHLLVELDDSSGNIANYNPIISARRINDGLFHHIAVARQGVTVQVYVDGVLDSAGSTPAVIDVSNSATLTAGVSACNLSNRNVPLNGQLDEIDLFNRSLTAAEIKSIFDAGSFGKCKTQSQIPAILSVNPNSGQQGRSNLAVTIAGNFTHFSTASVVTFGGSGLTAGVPSSATATSLTVPLTIAANAPLGAQGIQVVTGTEAVTLANAFTVIAGAPIITSVSPSSGQQGQQNVSVNLVGAFTHFVQGISTVTFGQGTAVAGLTVASPTSATAVVSVDRIASPGFRDVIVTTGPEVVTFVNGFEVRTRAPFLYISNIKSNSVSVVDSSTDSIVSTIPVGSPPEEIAVSPDGSKAYVTIGTFCTAGLVKVIDTSSNTVVGTITSGLGTFSRGIAISPDGTKGLVGNVCSNSVSVLDLASSTVVATIAGINRPIGIVYSRDGTKAFIASGSPNNKVVVIDAGTNQITATISVGVDPHNLIISPDSSRLYVPNWGTSDASCPAGAGSVSVIDTIANAVVAVVPSTGACSNWTSITPDGANLYVSDTGGPLTVIDTTTNTIKKRIVVGSESYGLSVTPDGSRVYVSENSSNGVWAIDTSTNEVVDFVTFPLVNGQPIGAFGSAMTPIVGGGTPPLILFSKPSGASQGQSLGVAVTAQGTHFAPSTQVAFGAGVSTTSITVSGPTTLVAQVNVSPAATVGSGPITVTTGSEVVGLANGFAITASGGLPTLLSTTPNAGQQGINGLQVTLVGQNTHFIQGTTVVSFGAGVTVTSLTINSPTTATATLNIDPAATPGVRVVTAITGLESVNLATGFTVQANPNGPSISSVSPSVGPQGQGGPVAIVGVNTHFLQGTTQVDFSSGITVSSVTVTCPTCLTAEVGIADNAPVGAHNITVTTGTETASLTGGFTVLAGTPTLTSMVPATAKQGLSVPISFTGKFTHWMQGATQLSLGTGITVTSVAVASATALTAQISIDPSAAIGTRTPIITTGAEIVSQPDIFSVQSAVTTVTASPTSGQQAQTLSTVVSGVLTHFVQGTSVVDFGPGIAVGTVMVANSTTLTAQLTISDSAATGPRTVTVTTGSEIVSALNAFTVNPGTIISSLSPGGAYQNQTVSVAITGQLTNFVQGTTQASFGAGISVGGAPEGGFGPVTVAGPTAATAQIVVNAAATPGPRTVQAKTNTEVAPFTNGFSVVVPFIISSISPSSAYQGQQNLTVAIVGQNTHFAQGSSVLDLNAGITVASVTITDATHLTAVINVAGDAPIAVRDVAVTTGTEFALLKAGFTTTGPPSLVSITPNNGKVGQTDLAVTIVGQNTHFTNGSTIGLGTGITASGIAATDSTHLSARLAIASDAPVGFRQLTVTTGSEVVSLTNTFGVNTGVNQAPIVTIAPTWSLILPGQLPLTYTVTDDGLPSGGSLTVTWSTVSGPGTVGFQNQTPTGITAAFSAPGAYVLQISATDTLLTTTQNITVTVTGTNPPPPTVSISSPTEGTSITTLTSVVSQKLVE